MNPNLFPTRTPLDVRPLASQEAPPMSLASVTLTTTYRPPAEGWPPVDMLGRPMDVDLVTVTVTVRADHQHEVSDLVSLRSAASKVVWTERPSALPPFVQDLVADALAQGYNVIRGAR
ncbi:hypothetical protein FK529_05690 [Tsukamurella asaccharolytica]|uniref:Uncharacterized protein n=1 Tax=Tsukamurella asaccharolytica TaxID=2592067 RepID=A0A5C5RE08_9ACTN|nr:hypothetical protein [Tsukamurella asaccharolytica]TWS20814.1 hypothetical protein FK529_05690 [Tsukamurella asaccharolytica]